MSRVRSFLTSHGLDVLIVAAAAGGAVGTLLSQGPEHPTGVLLWLEAAAVAAIALVLLLRRRAPFAAPASTWLLGTAISFLDGRVIVAQLGAFVAGFIASLLLGSLRNDLQARVGLVIVVSGAATVAYNDPSGTVGSLFSVPVPFAIAWLVGFALRERAEEAEVARRQVEQAERDREVAARVAVAEERSRIARELHDVVAHAVSVMVLQVGAVRHRMPDSDAENREALKNVEQAGRTALAEMRRLLDAMRREGDGADLVPQPGLDRLESLVRDVRAAGLDVSLRVEGRPVELPRGLDLSAYRILQEGLTNILKHAEAEHADVEVEYGPDELRIEVRDDGRGDPTNDGLGHGLVGIRERVKLYGGAMSAGPRDGGGFALCALLPLDGG